jgi:hypothetical protein
MNATPQSCSHRQRALSDTPARLTRCSRRAARPIAASRQAAKGGRGCTASR